MLAGSMLQYTSPDYLWWVLAAWLLLKLANGGDPRWWLGLGLAIGLGMMTRYTMLFCVAGIVVAILATQLRRQLATPWPWVGVALSLLVFAPNAWRSEEHTSELQSLMRISYAVFCLKKKINTTLTLLTKRGQPLPN